MKSLDTVTFLDFLLILTLHVVIELILKPLVDELELLLQIHGFIMRLSRTCRCNKQALSKAAWNVISYHKGDLS